MSLCMKFKNLFSGQNKKKKINNLLSTDVERVAKNFKSFADNFLLINSKFSRWELKVLYFYFCQKQGLAFQVKCHSPILTVSTLQTNICKQCRTRWDSWIYTVCQLVLDFWMTVPYLQKWICPKSKIEEPTLETQGWKSWGHFKVKCCLNIYIRQKVKKSTWNP